MRFCRLDFSADFTIKTVEVSEVDIEDGYFFNRGTEGLKYVCVW